MSQEPKSKPGQGTNLQPFFQNPELLPYTGNAVVRYLRQNELMRDALDDAQIKTNNAAIARQNLLQNEGLLTLTEPQERDDNILEVNATRKLNLEAGLKEQISNATTHAMHQRNPFVLTCQQWMTATPARYIYCAVNPSDIQWKIALRAKDQKTRGGTVQHLWKSRNDARRDTFYDEPVLTINFQAGNILPITDRPAATVNKSFGIATADNQRADPIVPDGMRNFYDFMELMDTPRQFQSLDASGNPTGPVRDNPVYILYNSRIFPSMALTGMWTQDGFSFSDKSENPNEISNWTASFIVHDSYPKINSPQSLIATYIRAGFGKI